MNATAPRIIDIEKAVCEYFELSHDEILSVNRKRAIARPRQIAIYLAAEYTDKTRADIARHFCRDHTTVNFAIERIAQLQTYKPKIALYVAACRERIEANGNRLAAALSSGPLR